MEQSLEHSLEQSYEIKEAPPDDEVPGVEYELERAKLYLQKHNPCAGDNLWVFLFQPIDDTGVMMLLLKKILLKKVILKILTMKINEFPDACASGDIYLKNFEWKALIMFLISYVFIFLK